MTKPLMRNMTNEELFDKINWEGFEYFFLDYVSPDSIADEDLQKSVRQLKLAWEEIVATLDEAGYDEP